MPKMYLLIVDELYYNIKIVYKGGCLGFKNSGKTSELMNI
jgi:hypothetical protein